MTYNSSFQDRAGQAAKAKQKALDQLRARPPVDEKARRRAQGRRAEAGSGAKPTRPPPKEADRKAAAEASAADAAATAAAIAPPKSEAERKAARDAQICEAKGPPSVATPTRSVAGAAREPAHPGRRVAKRTRSTSRRVYPA